MLPLLVALGQDQLTDRPDADQRHSGADQAKRAARRRYTDADEQRPDRRARRHPRRHETPPGEAEGEHDHARHQPVGEQVDGDEGGSAVVHALEQRDRTSATYAGRRPATEPLDGQVAGGSHRSYQPERPAEMAHRWIALAQHVHEPEHDRYGEDQTGADQQIGDEPAIAVSGDGRELAAHGVLEPGMNDHPDDHQHRRDDHAHTRYQLAKVMSLCRAHRCSSSSLAGAAGGRSVRRWRRAARRRPPTALVPDYSGM
ncbi:hypothetical protein HRbin41_01605 [bacterium HR41]|nr:hypothetical protein HRbin41_01605 [bacterium HR41]